ncbi:glutathione S-transferase family protein [Pikeienuella sp. HZG-20]|uniref:glutathione S-transferase family protein n=1 Tax=Paludibacillus litoralis TaxID=3133267 RepID=UPI0030EB5CF6
MPEITLYGNAVSAFVAKARIALDFKGLPYREAPAPGGHGAPEYRALIPAGSIPGLTIDGAPLHDSNAIIEYLEEIAPEPALLPKAPYERALARALLGFHDTRLEPAASAMFPLIKRDWRREPERVAAGLEGIEAAYARLAPLVTRAPFHLGAAPTIADLSYPVTIQMIGMLTAEFGRKIAPPPAIAAWARASGEIPAAARSLRIAGAAMEAWLAGFRGARA